MAEEKNRLARQAILERVRQGLGQPLGGNIGARRQAAEENIRFARRGPQPLLEGEGLTCFCRNAEALSSTTERVSAWGEVPLAVARYLAANALGNSAVASPELAALEWSAAGLSVALRSASDADRVGITGCFCAIAETGTLMLVSEPETPPSLSLLPETHIALVPLDRIVPCLEEGLARLRRSFERLPPAVNLISGPSRTADIEQTLVLGAHGPRRVHILLIGTGMA